MQAKRTPPMVKTDTPGIYRRCKRYSVRWAENGKRKWTSFESYEEAVAFRRDVVIPFRRREQSNALPPTSIMPQRGPGWVYFFQSLGPDELVKIGWSADPTKRFKVLATAQPHGIALVALLPGPRTLERRIHEEFAGWRRSGEWFSREVLLALTDKFGVSSRVS